MRAILSVYDKAGLVEFARGLAEMGWELVSTGGTQRALADAGLTVRSVSDVTGFPEILDGRVKTLHPAVHGGLLARRDLPAHVAEIQAHGIMPVDLVCVNLYPFVETVRGGAGLEEALENIDIGGPTLLRAAAKNFPHVAVIVDPGDYEPVLAALRRGELPLSERRRLAYKAFQHVATYDTAVARYLLQGVDGGFPEQVTIALTKKQELRYGENPHQRGALYAEESLSAEAVGIVAARQLHGKELSYNNFLDADAAWRAVTDFTDPTVAVIKHTNPCGLASHDDLAEAFRRAFAGDPISAFGGIVAVNRTVDASLAAAIREARHPTSGQRLFLEIVIAPAYTEDALALLQRSRDLRILQVPAGRSSNGLEYRSVDGGVLVQEADRYADDEIGLQVVTRRAPTELEMADLRFAWKVVKHVKSNAIVVAKNRMLLGMGAGQPNRVTSVHLALRAAGEEARGAVLASDALFPFGDSVELAAQGGITAVIQPGGSIRDEESIQAADAHGIAMVFTGIRHFRH